MKLNYYIVGELPELKWDSVPEKTLEQFLIDNQVVFEGFEQDIQEIVFLNEIRNIELLLKFKLDQLAEKAETEESEIELFRPKICSLAFLEKFIDQPFVWHPDEYPMFMTDFFEEYTNLEDRYNNIEELYARYFQYLEIHEKSFYNFFGRILSTLFTVLSAYRIIKSGKDLESNLKGDPIIVQTILDNRSTTDLGLKNIFWEIPEIIALFDKEPIDLEHDFDRIVFHLLEEVGQETPFGDHVIYTYIIKYFILDRWKSMSTEKGDEILENIISG